MNSPELDLEGTPQSRRQQDRAAAGDHLNSAIQGFAPKGGGFDSPSGCFESMGAPKGELGAKIGPKEAILAGAIVGPLVILEALWPDIPVDTFKPPGIDGPGMH